MIAETVFEKFIRRIRLGFNKRDAIIEDLITTASHQQVAIRYLWERAGLAVDGEMNAYTSAEQSLMSAERKARGLSPETDKHGTKQ